MRAECRYVDMSRVDMLDWGWIPGTVPSPLPPIYIQPSFKVRWHAQALKYRRWTQGRATRWARGDLGPTRT